MEAKNRPSVVRLLIYMVLAAAMSGSLAGWVFSSNVFDWLAGQQIPTWSPSPSLMTAVWITLNQLIAISLWIVQRSDGGWIKHLSSLMILGLFAVIVLRFCIYIGGRDITLGFAVSLATWVYTLFTVGIVTRASKAAALLLWPLLIWISFAAVLSFELMRLNSGTSTLGAI